MDLVTFLSLLFTYVTWLSFLRLFSLEGVVLSELNKRNSFKQEFLICAKKFVLFSNWLNRGFTGVGLFEGDLKAGEFKEMS